MPMLGISVVLGFVVLTLWMRWRWKLTSTFADLGIPGPKPNLILGNILELYIKGPVKCHKEWVAKYGRVVGYYRGMKPILLVADPKLLKMIFVKDFTKFSDREAFNPLARLEELNAFSQSIFFLQGQKWKAVRSVLTPSFSTMKMRQMSSMMTDSVDLMVSVLHRHAESGKTVDIHNTYQRLTIDVITKAAFGVRYDVQTEEKSELLKVTNLHFRMPYRDPLLFIGLMVFPALRKLALKIQVSTLKVLNGGVSPIRKLREELRDVLVYRRNHPEVRKLDLLQLMIDTKISSAIAEIDVKGLEAGRDSDDESDMDSTKLGNESKSTRNMSDREIISNAFSVFLAGYETTSTALAFTSYALAKYPGIQERVYQEVKELMEREGQLEYGTVKELPYLDKVFNESLRMYPPVNLLTTRFAGEDIEYGSLKIPKRMVVLAPVYQLHHDPGLWQDPEVFDPERFNVNPNKDGITFMPFSVGPRNCMGTRFAQLEAKIALAKVLYNFRLVLPESQKGEIEIQLRLRTISPRYGVKVKLEKRMNRIE